MPGFSIVILTLNEAENLPLCLASIGAGHDVVVLDSGSTDRTVEVARAHGARVAVRPFDSFAGQRNYANERIEFKSPWVFHLDADEQFTPELLAECRGAANRSDLDGFYVAPRMLWFGQWIPRCTDYPAWQARFVRVPTFRFIDVGHGQREDPAMRMDYLRANYLHDLSHGGETEWLAKHRRYARAEARQIYAGLDRLQLGDVTSRDKLARRRALKRLSHFLPFRPALRFIYQYFLRGGLLDGRAGFQYCRLLAKYEGFTASELRVLRQRNR